MKPYKGYTPTFWMESGDREVHGIVEGLRDTIHFSATSVEELEQAFHDSVDDYLEWAAKDGFKPEKPYSGKLAFRTSPDHHRLISEAAATRAKSINQWMDDTLAEAARRTLAEGRQVIRNG